MHTDYRPPDRGREQGVDLSKDLVIVVDPYKCGITDIVGGIVGDMGYETSPTWAPEAAFQAVEELGPAAVVFYCCGNGGAIESVRRVNETVPIVYIGDQDDAIDDRLKVSLVARGPPGKDIDEEELAEKLRRLLGGEGADPESS